MLDIIIFIVITGQSKEMHSNGCKLAGNWGTDFWDILYSSTTCLTNNKPKN